MFLSVERCHHALIGPLAALPREACMKRSMILTSLVPHD
jgi:hypothetical protein